MDYEIVSRKDQDKSRGVALLLTGSVLVLLSYVVPFIAPLAMGGYGVYELVKKNYTEGLVAIGLAALFYFLIPLVSGLIWVLALGAAGFGLFFLIRGIRGRYLTS